MKYCGIDAARFRRGGFEKTSQSDEINLSKDTALMKISEEIGKSPEEIKKEFNIGDNHKSESFKGFKSPMALAVIVESFEDYKAKFSETIKRELSEYTEKSIPKVISSYGINKIVGDPHTANKIKEDIVKILADEIDHVRLVYSYFNDIEEVYCYKDQPGPKISTKTFIEKFLDPAYPHIAIWKVDQEGDYEIMSDYFQGKITEAWEEIDKESNFSVYSKGDECNPLIATADIVLDVFDNKMKENNYALYPDESNTVLNSLNLDSEIDWIGDNLINLIKPKKNYQIPTSKYIAKPTIYAFSKKTRYIGKKALLNTPRGMDLKKIATQKEGCLKFYDRTTDRSYLSNNDLVTYFDEEGKESAELLKKGGLDVEIFHFENADQHVT